MSKVKKMSEIKFLFMLRMHFSQADAKLLYLPWADRNTRLTETEFA